LPVEHAKESGGGGRVTGGGPLPQYRAMVADGRLRDDPTQRMAAEKLQLLHARLRDYNPARPKKVGLGVFGWGREKLTQSFLPGLYLYGEVGRGKSMLMDLFYETAPVPARRRVHFHAFMQEVHAGIAAARARGVNDPVRPVADGIADKATLLCFDEMQISDITDAMLVGRLFERLFERGVVMVVTSNRHPDDLYRNGLNRALFLPFIALIKQRLEVVHLDSPTDHRLGAKAAGQAWHQPLGPEADAALNAAWSHLAGGRGRPLELPVQGRRLVIPQHLNRIGRASFEDLCEAPLGPADFLAIAAALDVLILDQIPVLGGEDRNAAKRFVTLVDVLYEAKVRLIASAEAEPALLYPDGEGSFEFRRTVSRLAEMRGQGWGRAAPAEERAGSGGE
jgi:cell division protein ZapE